MGQVPKLTLIGQDTRSRRPNKNLRMRGLENNLGTNNVNYLIFTFYDRINDDPARRENNPFCYLSCCLVLSRNTLFPPSEIKRVA